MKCTVFFLRKVRSFNKSRYSRNRQTTRVAFYLSLLVNILIIFGVFSLFYKVLMKLTLLWWPFYLFLFSFVFGAAIRNNVITPSSIFKRIKLLF